MERITPCALSISVSLFALSRLSLNNRSWGKQQQQQHQQQQQYLAQIQAKMSSLGRFKAEKRPTFESCRATVEWNRGRMSSD